ncbi:hypothetical protein PG984_003199 [Apiospora sp. TS-2023a]
MGGKSTPTPINVLSHKHYNSLVSRDDLEDRIKRQDRLLNIQQYEIHALRRGEAALHRGAAARDRENVELYRENIELRWAILKAQCWEQARQLFGPQLSHVFCDVVIWKGKLVSRASVHCVGRRPSDSIGGRPERTALPLPSSEQQKYELEQLDGCLADALQQRSQWMPRRFILEVVDWLNDSDISTPPGIPPPHLFRCLRSRTEGEAQMLPTDGAKVSADAALVVDDGDSGEESHAEAVVTP